MAIMTTHGEERSGAESTNFDHHLHGLLRGTEPRLLQFTGDSDYSGGTIELPNWSRWG